MENIKIEVNCENRTERREQQKMRVNAAGQTIKNSKAEMASTNVNTEKEKVVSKLADQATASSSSTNGAVTQNKNAIEKFRKNQANNASASQTTLSRVIQENLTDIDLTFSTNDGSKDMSLVIFLFNKNQLAQSAEQQTVTVPKLTIPMKNMGYGEFETSMNLKQIIKAFYGNKNSKKRENQEEERECHYERQLYESLQSFKHIHYVFEADNKQLRTDRFQTQKSTANCLGAIAFRALGRLAQVNERNVELEVQEAMQPLMKKLESESDLQGNKVLNLKDFKNGKEAALLDMLQGKNKSYDIVSETDSTTHSSDICSRMDLDFAHENDEVLEIVSQMSETDIDNLQLMPELNGKSPELPKQFQGNQNKWQQKRNQLVLQALMMQSKGKQEAKKTTAEIENQDYYCDGYYYCSSKKMIAPIERKSIIICSNCQNNNNNNANTNCVDCNLLQLDEKAATASAAKVATTTTTTTTTDDDFKFKFNMKDKKDKKVKKQVAFVEDVEVPMPMPAWPQVPAWPLAEGAAKIQQHHHQQHHVVHSQQHVVVGNVVGGVCF